MPGVPAIQARQASSGLNWNKGRFLRFTLAAGLRGLDDLNLPGDVRYLSVQAKPPFALHMVSIKSSHCLLFRRRIIFQIDLSFGP
jgi:hypothetical protein